MSAGKGARGLRADEARKKAGLKKASFARSVGVSWPTVNSWSKGEYDPTPENMERIAEVTGAGLDYLHTGASALADALKSRVDPVDEHPLIKRARQSDQYPAWVLASIPKRFHHRNGRYEYFELVRFLDDVHSAGLRALEALESRIGPSSHGGS